MIDDTNSFAKQENNSCSAAITGLSYRTCSGRSDSDLNSTLIQLAKEALLDDLSTAENVFIVIGNCCGANLILAQQLLSSLELPGQGFSQQISNALQGLDTAINQLQISNAVLLVLCDSINSIEGTQEEQNSYYLSAIVLRPFSQAIEYGKKIYASIALLLQTNQLFELKQKYKDTQIPMSSINLFTLNSISENTITAEVAKLSDWLIEDVKRIEDTKKTEGVNKVGKQQIFKEDSWCSLRIDRSNRNNHSANGLTSLIDTIISIQQRTFLSMPEDDFIQQIDFKHSPFYANFAIRPWFHPQVHPHFRSMSPQPNYNSSPRRAALHIVEQNGQIYHLLAEEFADANELKQRNFQQDWPSELFTFFAEDRFQLVTQLQSLEALLSNHQDGLNLKDLAFSINHNTLSLINKSLTNKDHKEQPENAQSIKAAFVCGTIEEFLFKIKDMINTCLLGKFSQSSEATYFENNDTYWSNQSNLDVGNEKNKLAFVLPGLGAAYPNMLAELCLHFPEIRAIFDFVDYLSVSGGSKLKPSDRIFCRLDARTKTFRETPASLAVMDSAVVTVLMAEWAIFTLLLNLDIVPDVLLGSSTGEFAALTMSGAVDIFKAAPLFYHLSTGMVHALPVEQLINLRSLRVNDAYEKIENELASYKDKVYLSANLSPRQLILTGERESINSLLKSFESKHISADFLPFAIPYHTSLVADVVSANNPDIEALQISNPLIESWSCSLAAPYPNKPEKIKQMTTDLFSKPILFRQSIEALYKNGVRNFVEVGPRGNLAPIVTEILQQQPHLSLAANRSDISAITQLQNVLAILFVSNIYMDLSYLYARRAPRLLSLQQEQFAPIVNPQPTHSLNIAVAQPADLKFDPQKNCQQLQAELINLTNSFQAQLQELENQVMSYFISGKTLSKITTDTITNADQYLSSEISLTKIFPNLIVTKNVACRRLLEEDLSANEDAFMSLAKKVLVPVELNQLQSFKQPAKRRQWLAGRIAAKEAVRSLVASLFNIQLPNTDIAIDVSDSGKPYLTNMNAPIIGAKEPVISITHKDGAVIAVAANSAMFSSVGIDLESKLLDEDLEDFILTAQERGYIQELSGTERAIGIKKIWSAKESVAKLLGLGLPECLTQLSVIDVEPITGKYQILANQSIDDKNLVFTNKINPYLAHVASLDKSILSLAML